MRTHWRTVLGISLAVALLVETTLVLVQGLLMNDIGQTTLDDPNASPDDVLRALRDSMIGTGLVTVISTVAVIIATALLTTITSRAVLGRPVSAGEAWREARPQIPRLFGLILLLGLILFGTVLAGALPGILVLVGGGNDGAAAALLVLGILAGLVVAGWLMIRFYLATPALMLERQGIVKSMSRSAKLVRGSWWRIFGITLLAGAMAEVASYVIQLPFTLLGMFSGALGSMNLGADPHPASVLVAMSGYVLSLLVGQLVSQMIVATFPPLVAGLLYVDRRIRTENLGPVLAEAAAVPPQFTA
jgi:hypothetical protein